MCYTEALLNEGTLPKITKLTSGLIIFFQLRSLSLSRLGKKKRSVWPDSYLLLDWSIAVIDVSMLSCKCTGDYIPALLARKTLFLHCSAKT